MPCLHDEPYARLEVLNPVLVRRRAAVVPFRARARARARDRAASRARRHGRGGARSRRATTPRASASVTARRARSSCSRAGASGGKGWDWLLAAFHFAIRQYDLPVRPRDHRCEPGRFSGRPVRPGPRSRLPRGSGSRERVRGRRRHTCNRAPTRASRARSWSRGWPEPRCSRPPAAKCCAGTATDPEGASRSPTSSSSRSAFRSSRLRPTEAARLAKAGREYVLANYQWDVVLDAMEVEPAGAAVRVLVVGSYPPPAHGESNRTVATVHRLGAQGDDVDVLSAARIGSAAPRPDRRADAARCSRGGAAATTTRWSCRSRAAHRCASRTAAARASTASSTASVGVSRSRALAT